MLGWIEPPSRIGAIKPILDIVKVHSSISHCAPRLCKQGPMRTLVVCEQLGGGSALDLRSEFDMMVVNIQVKASN
jgi:hypothetical protein